ncbi:MAG: hypothetical protein WBK75_03300 [Acutalibacteraceae bacterium]
MIKINRTTGFVDKKKSYKVMINEHQIGVIHDGQTKTFDLPAGEHIIYLKIDWCRSKKLKFAIEEGQTVEFDCGNALKGWRILLDMFYVTILKNHYLWIKIKENDKGYKENEGIENPDELDILNDES